MEGFEFELVCSSCLTTRGLLESERLPHPILTPATKASSGHDLNITEPQAAEIAGAKNYETARARALSIYQWAHEFALARGIVIADGASFKGGV